MIEIIKQMMYARKMNSVGQGSALQGQFDWEKALVGVQNSAR